MSTDFQRVKCSSVTEAIALAMEHAEEMQNIVILYDVKPEIKDNVAGFFTNNDLEVKELNWLIDTFKQWLLSRVVNVSED